MKKKKVQKEQSAAVLTIKSPGKMTSKGRKEIAGWLRQQANNLVKDGKLYTDGRFTARYMY